MQAEVPECRRIYPANDSLCSCKTVRHHIEQSQLMILLQKVVPDFISAEEWASHSLDLNPLDYSVCENLCMRSDMNRMHTYINVRKQ